MQNIPLFTREQKYQLALFCMLVISSIISVGLFAARTAPSPRGPYTSLVLNLVLAWVPFVLAWFVNTFSHLPKTLTRALVFVCAVLWLLFFPNAFYILTDFQHIAIRDTNTPAWYDVIMLLWFSWSGLFLGMISLYFMQIVVMRWLGWIYSWAFIVGAIILGSLGVYIGRFIDVNSWDVLIDPFGTLGMFREHFLYAPYLARFLIFFFLFTLFFLFVYMTIFVFARLVNDESSQS